MREGRENSLNCSLFSNHVEVNILLICKCLVHFFPSCSIELLDSFFSKILFIGILFLSGENFRFPLFFVIFVIGVCLSMYTLFPLIGCAGSVGISLASRVMYLFVCVSVRCVEWRAGTILFGHFGGVDGGTVRIFLSLRLCSGGYGTVETVNGVVRVFLCFLQFAVSSLGGWISAVGIFVLYVCW